MSKSNICNHIFFPSPLFTSGITINERFLFQLNCKMTILSKTVTATRNIKAWIELCFFHFGSVSWSMKEIETYSFLIHAKCEHMKWSLSGFILDFSGPCIIHQAVVHREIDNGWGHASLNPIWHRVYFIMSVALFKPLNDTNCRAGIFKLQLTLVCPVFIMQNSNLPNMPKAT